MVFDAEADVGMQPAERVEGFVAAGQLHLAPFIPLPGPQWQNLAQVLSTACLLELPTLDQLIGSLVPRLKKKMFSR